MTHPDHWHPSAIDAYDDTMADTPDLSGPAFASLVEACELLTTAYRLGDVAREAGYVSRGSMGQEVLHPAVTEARHSRAEASKILARLIPPRNKGAAVVRGRHGGIR